jgi:hypothetical protein
MKNKKNHNKAKKKLQKQTTKKLSLLSKKEIADICKIKLNKIWREDSPSCEIEHVLLDFGDMFIQFAVYKN